MSVSKFKSKLSSNSTGNVGSVLGDSNSFVSVKTGNDSVDGVFGSTGPSTWVSLDWEVRGAGSSSVFSSIDGCCGGRECGSTDFWTDLSFLCEKKRLF